MRRTSAILIWTIFSIHSQDSLAEDFQPPQYHLKVHLESANDPSPTLDVEMEFNGSKPIKIPTFALPWGNRRSLRLVSVKLDDALTPIEEAGYFDDPRVGYVTLKPGDSLSGKIPLKNRFPALYAAFHQDNVMIFWTYELVSANGDSMGRTSGGVYVPRTDSNR